MEALKTPALYVGALSSRRNNDLRWVWQREFGVSQAEVQALRDPVGLNLGGKTPPEIALAIVAEMMALRCDVSLDDTLADWTDSDTEYRVSA